MPTCRLCFSVYPREQFIHGNGPKAQVCVRCGLERGMVTEEEVASLYSNSTANARFSALARRWSPLMWLSVLWIAWIVFLNDVEPWGLYTLILLALFSLLVPLYMFFFSSKHMAVMARLTPEYERPKGHWKFLLSVKPQSEDLWIETLISHERFMNYIRKDDSIRLDWILMGNNICTN